MDAAERARLERAKNRSSWPGARYLLGSEPSDDLSATTTPEERIAMATALSEELARVSGSRRPPASRATMPGRVFRPGEIVPDDGQP